MKRIVAAAALLALSGGAAAQAPSARSFNAVYSISGRGVEAGEFLYGVKFENGAYEATARRRMTGAVGLIVGNSQNYSYSVRGRMTPGGLDPEAYRHQGGKRNRLVTVDFSGAEPVTEATPVMGMGNPPATPQQKAGTVDQVTAIASLIVAEGDPCTRTVRVLMDGRSRFDFVLRPAGKVRLNTRVYRGEAIRCTVAFRPIAGFPDPQEAATLTFLFAPTASGLYAPLRIEMPTDIEQVGVAVLEARSFSIT
jgi:Protein of unknown function (DUF3108)